MIKKLPIWESLIKTVKRKPDFPVFKHKDKEFSYKELENLAKRYAQYFKTFYKCDKNTKVIGIGSTTFEYLSVIYAMFGLGCFMIKIDNKIISEQLNNLISETKADIILVGKQWKQKVINLNIFKIIICYDDEDTVNILNNIDISNFVPNIITQKDPSIGMFTGGTTGKPKIIVHSQHSFYYFINNALCDENDTIFIDQFSCNAIFASVMKVIDVGGTIRCPDIIGIENETSFLDIIKYINEINILFLFGVQIVDLIKIFTRHSISQHRLKYIVYAGVKIPSNYIVSLQKLININILNEYGMSECGTISRQCINKKLINPNENKLYELQSVGYIRENIKNFIKIIDDYGNNVKINKIGEIVVSENYPGLFLGYIESGILRYPSIVNGYFHTGDLIKKDEKEIIYLIDRISSKIKTKDGNSIYCNEIEEILNKNNQVSMSIVFCTESIGNIGDDIIAYVVPINKNLDETTSKKQLIDFFSKQSLYPDIILKDIIFVNSLPINKKNKLDRLKLKNNYLKNKPIR